MTTLALKKILPALFFLPSTSPFYASVSMGAVNTIFTLVVSWVWCRFNPVAPTPKADTIIQIHIWNPYSKTQDQQVEKVQSTGPVSDGTTQQLLQCW